MFKYFNVDAHMYLGADMTTPVTADLHKAIENLSKAMDCFNCAVREIIARLDAAEGR